MVRCIIVLLCLVSWASARPPYRKALTDLLDLPAASPLNSCSTCHLPGAEDDPPHNSFGLRLKAIRAELRKAGKPVDITARLLAIADEDTDGDGVGNLLELLAEKAPHDAKQKPEARAVDQARERRTKVLAALTGYRWRPFDRVERPAVPSLGVSNPIDAFLESKRRERALIAVPEANRPTLLRRVTLDLTGLPPTVEELRAFVNDTRPDAYERVVDRLLASPAYGERWGRQWMDVWRYSDWAGFGAQIRDSQPHIWRWRDWIVESLDADVPYSRMVVEMLAGDEAAPDNPDVLRATGFLVRNWKLLSRERWLQDTVDHSAMAFLGVTLGCAKCHDHFYDAISTQEYYRVRAIFSPHHVRIDRLPGEPNTAKDGLARVFDRDLDIKTFVFLRGDDRTPGKEALMPGVPELLGGKFEIKPVKLPATAVKPDRRPFVMAELVQSLEATLALHERTVRAARVREATAGFMGPLWSAGAIAYRSRLRDGEELARDTAAEAVIKNQLLLQVEALEDAKSDTRATAEKLVASERRFAVLKARQSVLALKHGIGIDPKSKVPLAKQRSDADKALAAAEAAFLAPASTKYTPRVVPTYPETSTGRRLAYANWIVSRDNPLAARVAVNHVWARHFGTGIVPGMFDFGKNAPPATHPELIDWMAVEFMESGWSFKNLHRLMLTSAAYRADSRPRADMMSRDPDNVYLWRFTPRRLEAEAIRDALYFVAGTLDRRRGGPEVSFQQALEVSRRSVYVQSAQEKQAEFLLLFDCASVTEAYQRKQAIMPSQALALLNSEAAVQAGRLAAGRLMGKNEGDFVRSAFETLLGRLPTTDEMAECLAFLQTSRNAQRGREVLMRVLINHHEFVTIR